MQNIEYAEYDIPTDFARKELIHGRIALDIELRAQTESATRTSSHTFFQWPK
jgi:hypothetical protein